MRHTIVKKIVNVEITYAFDTLANVHKYEEELDKDVFSLQTYSTSTVKTSSVT